ncbi:mannosyltransferase family protein [Actinomadura keratinilytica]
MGRTVPRRAARLLDRGDREALWLYLLTRISLWGTAYCTRLLFPDRPGAREPAPLLTAFERWDWHHYLHIARDGYFPGPMGSGATYGDNREAFFPGFPMLLRAVHTVVPHWTAAGLLISLVAGAVAVVALGRTARWYTAHAEAGRRTVLFFLVSPCAVFLVAGYTEALFLALALPAWLAALRHHWALAALLTALATTVRVSGLFLAAALAVHLVAATRAGGRLRALPWLALLPPPPAVRRVPGGAHRRLDGVEARPGTRLVPDLPPALGRLVGHLGGGLRRPPPHRVRPHVPGRTAGHGGGDRPPLRPRAAAPVARGRLPRPHPGGPRHLVLVHVPAPVHPPVVAAVGRAGRPEPAQTPGEGGLPLPGRAADDDPRGHLPLRAVGGVAARPHPIGRSPALRRPPRLPSLKPWLLRTPPVPAAPSSSTGNRTTGTGSRSTSTCAARSASGWRTGWARS